MVGTISESTTTMWWSDIPGIVIVAKPDEIKDMFYKDLKAVIITVSNTDKLNILAYFKASAGF